MDKAKVLETCNEIKRLHELQVRLIEEHNPANRAKIRAVTDQIRNVTYQHIDAIHANPGTQPSEKKHIGRGLSTGSRGAAGRSTKKRPARSYTARTDTRLTSGL